LTELKQAGVFFIKKKKKNWIGCLQHSGIVCNYRQDERQWLECDISLAGKDKKQVSGNKKVGHPTPIFLQL
jgi:hypothetical protein